MRHADAQKRGGMNLCQFPLNPDKSAESRLALVCLALNGLKVAAF